MVTSGKPSEKNGDSPAEKYIQYLEDVVHTEIFDLKNQDNFCYGSDFPLALHQATGGLVGADKSPLTCGGFDDDWNYR